MTTSSVTRAPAAMRSLAFLPTSVPAATAALRQGSTRHEASRREIRVAGREQREPHVRGWHVELASLGVAAREQRLASPKATTSTRRIDSDAPTTNSGSDLTAPLNHETETKT